MLKTSNVPRLPAIMSAMVLLYDLGSANPALTVDPAVAAIAAKEVASPEVQAAVALAEPAAQQAIALKHLADAANEAIDPVVFTGRTLLLVPQFARPARVPWTIVKSVAEISHPFKAIGNLGQIPGDLWAPFEATGKILTDTPRLLGPVKALGSMGQFAAATVRSARSLPSDREGLIVSAAQELR
jgi:hypothetical protein